MSPQLFKNAMREFKGAFKTHFQALDVYVFCQPGKTLPNYCLLKTTPAFQLIYPGCWAGRNISCSKNTYNIFCNPHQQY